MSGVDDLYLLCREFLDACVEAVSLAPGGPIPRAFVAPGPPAWDCCDQVSVHAGGPAEGDTAPFQPPLTLGHRPAVQGSVHLATLTATVLRCVPTVDESLQLPAPAEIEASAVKTLGDVWAIWNHVRHRYRAGTLFQSPSGSRELFFDPAVALYTAGGCAGWQIQIRVQLGGYPPLAGEAVPPPDPPPDPPPAPGPHT